jgi:GH15 family glucan-1,4-alpha-glucosidase
VQREGWSPDRQAYVQYLGGTTLDASLLVMPLVKFAGPSDPRFLSTLDRIGEELVSDSLVRRYETDGSDGLPGSEGTFNLCSFWYVEALTRAGRIKRAGMSSKRCSPTPTTWACSPRRSAPPARRWATSRRHSPTSP